MRILIAAIVASAGITAARAADLPVDSSAGYLSAISQRTAPLVVYDYQPGVVVRAYWEAPWRHRHYYPRTGERPEIGRDEDLSAPYESYTPAQTFKRSWSTTSNFPPEQPRISAPRTAPPQIPGPWK